jgi:hypothetical protein
MLSGALQTKRTAGQGTADQAGFQECGAQPNEKVKMNTGTVNRILPTVLFLSGLLWPARTAFAQTIEPPIDLDD